MVARRLSAPAGRASAYARLRRWLPPVPVLPPRLWATAGAAALAGLSYGFREELWPGHPSVGNWSLGVLPFLLLAGIWQVLPILWRWPPDYGGPGWLRLGLRIAATVAAVGLTALSVVLWLVCLVLVVLMLV